MSSVTTTYADGITVTSGGICLLLDTMNNCLAVAEADYSTVNLEQEYL